MAHKPPAPDKNPFSNRFAGWFCTPSQPGRRRSVNPTQAPRLRNTGRRRGLASRISVRSSRPRDRAPVRRCALDGHVAAYYLGYGAAVDLAGMRHFSTCHRPHYSPNTSIPMEEIFINTFGRQDRFLKTIPIHRLGAFVGDIKLLPTFNINTRDAYRPEKIGWVDSHLLG